MPRKLTGKPNGKPRKYDREDIAKKLIAWAKLKKSTNLCGFCEKYELDPGTMPKWADHDPDGFGASYRLAKAILAQKRDGLLSEGKMHSKVYDLNALNYDHFAWLHYQEKVKVDANASKTSTNTETREDKETELQNKLMEMSARLEIVLEENKQLKSNVCDKPQAE